MGATHSLTRGLTFADFLRVSDGAAPELVWGVLMGLVFSRRLQLAWAGEGSGRRAYFYQP